MPTIEQLEEIARVARVDTLKSLRAAQSGHPGSSLSIIEALVTLYFDGYLRYRPEEPGWPERDIFVLSQGHAAPGLYSVLALAGYFERKGTVQLRQLNSPFEGHVKRGSLPGIECSAGSLGQGLNFGSGVALAVQMAQSDRNVFVMMSDGEQQEGSTWEAVMFAGSRRFARLTALVDVNGNQINGKTHDIMPVMDGLAGKYASFGWDVHEIDGHNFQELRGALNRSKEAAGPSVVISHTTTGKGVPYMEGDYHWHHGKVTNDLFLEAMVALGEDVSPRPDESWCPGVTPMPIPTS